MTGEKSKERLYEEEDYTWSKKELMHKRPSNSKRKTIAGLFLLVAASFIPENIQKQIKAFSKN